MFSQLQYIAGLFLVSPLLPFLFLQGIYVRRTVPRLPEAGLNREGVVEGEAPILRLLLIGESTIAGVGISNHRNGISGALARQLNEMTRRKISWMVRARSGYTSRQVRERLIPKLQKDATDCIVIGLGGNDTFRLNSPRRWRKDMEALISRIRERQPDCPIVIAQLPPVGAFPAFPLPLRKFLGWQVDLLRRAIRHLPRQYAGVFYMEQPIRLEEWLPNLPAGTTIDDLFSDGVHPSAVTYQIWGRELAGFIQRQGLFGGRSSSHAS